MFEEFVNVDHILKPEVAYWYLSFNGWVEFIYHNNLNTFAHSAAAVEEEEAVQESFRFLET
ncbi:hypothetical protein IGI04_004285 [Brassica rapa subsp. trilocularis]|uniref:Uncharacterized protein n=1 Tax=Brassica rapa subsp. trilocularis TaxID=1813537 RepID=A0ABQ7NCG3_BRACM|nr:hypothetical protein IGI04_004285 [Brassica rapa subsp. trilocularis]